MRRSARESARIVSRWARNGHGRSPAVPRGRRCCFVKSAPSDRRRALPRHTQWLGRGLASGPIGRRPSPACRGAPSRRGRQLPVGLDRVDALISSIVLGCFMFGLSCCVLARAHVRFTPSQHGVRHPRAVHAHVGTPHSRRIPRHSAHTGLRARAAPARLRLRRWIGSRSGAASSRTDCAAAHSREWSRSDDSRRGAGV